VATTPGTQAGEGRRDGQRARVYAAEELWRAELDAARLGAREVEVAGSRVVLPAELRFGDLDTVRGWLRALVPAYPGVGELRVRSRRGQARAHYESPGTVALPAPVLGEPWALRESVVLHEVAHHLAGTAAAHGPAFTAALLDLVRHALGEEAAFVLRVRYAEAGARVG